MGFAQLPCLCSTCELAALVLTRRTQVSVVWRRTCPANLQPRNAQRARSLADTRPQLINLPNQYVMGSEEGSVGVAAGTFETFKKKVGTFPLLRTFFFKAVL